MDRTLLAELIYKQVQATTLATIGQRIATETDTLAAELLQDEAFRAEMLGLLRVAFQRAIADLTRENGR